MSDLTLRQLAREQAAWQARNFPDNDPEDPLLGIVEEVGELAHAHLKTKQGIRRTADLYHAQAVDAVGDIVIYLAGYCFLNSIDLQAAVEETWSVVKKRDWIKNKVDGSV